MRKILVSWSSGKDSAWTLHLLRQNPDCEIVGLLTTFNSAFDRVAMHAVRSELVQAQAVAAGLPLWSVPLPWPCSNQAYEQAMRRVCARALSEGIEAIAFGDLFLADIRAYREAQLRDTGLEPLFPLWHIPTNKLAKVMIESGLRAKITCIDPKKLNNAFAGAEFNLPLLSQLPSTVDPCGENGEFHTFVYDGPMFRHPVAIRGGEICERDGFVFADLLLAGEPTNSAAKSLTSL
jgi:uncharacterized protein (TIGR00290 family)